MTKLDTAWILSNSPGEISNWMQPICHALAKRFPDIKIEIFLSACLYASGREAEYAKRFPNVHRVFGPKESTKYYLGKAVPEEIRPGESTRGAIIYLGGEIDWAVRLHKQAPSFQLIGYSDKKGYTDSRFQRLYNKYKDGDLMASHCLQYQAKNRGTILQSLGLPNKPYCLLLTGSRPRFFKPLYPFMAKVAQSCIDKKAPFTPLLVTSPFISKELAATQSTPPCPSVHLDALGDLDSRDLFSMAEFMLSIPGTATSEAAYMHCPHMVIVPFNRPEAFIFDGSAGILGMVPGLRVLIGVVASIFAWFRKPVLSQFNLRTGTQTIPEFLGWMSPETVADNLIREYGQRGEIKEALIGESLSEDLAKRMVNAIT